VHNAGGNLKEMDKMYGVKNALGLWLCHDSENGDIFWSEWSAHAAFWSVKEGAEHAVAYWTPSIEFAMSLPLRVVSGFFVED
jgi:hypothetical protein